MAFLFFPRTYTEVYAPILVESDTSSSSEDEFAHNVDCFNDKIVSVEDILENLATQIKSEKVSQFNINRADIWDGALRGFKCSSFDPAHTILVKFSDNTGYMESGIDTGGPKREFLELLMQHVKNRTLFEGRETEKYLTCDSVAFDNDEYFIIGRMIAVSMVHGGPGPQFISKNLFNYILCEGIFSPDTKDVCDPEIQMMLQKIKSSSSVECLRSTVEVYATMLMIAGCLCHVIRELSDKDKIVEDYLKWYFFTRNAACIQRFKEGLTTLNVLEAMKQNPSGFMKYFCFSEKKITSEIIENLFKAEFSQPGSNRRQEEVRTAAYWADYLLDIEGKTSFAEPSLEDILMFSTGVSSIPPIGFHPKPTVNFLHNESPYPIAQTCTNSLSIPIHKTYDKFKYHMNFGILNSPGFGQH
ncbi:G2/M phase-specific E3 ubiquitin-protein ligase-like [Erpetoichthys calabaricus]|uniref:G2/M phase-specific E3 ubiquitin-protein ligase-like n=1 Tax=Erpetoichthys calabaricus TaxID=27687 RepID=UPI002234E381|nr:G2/M phase-specific E3 ubiquitin-protein ligase-like [Erpetoichthys calabaricus]